MPLRETLQRIPTEYPAAKGLPLEGHALASFIRHHAEQALEEGLGELGAGLVVEGSPGQGNWAAVPWISVFDPAITTSATRGYYVVYLFHASEPIVHLSLNQGTTAVREEFGARARDILKDRADLMRKRVAEFADVAASDDHRAWARPRGCPAIMSLVMRWVRAIAFQPCRTRQCYAPTYNRSCAPTAR